MANGKPGPPFLPAAKRRSYRLNLRLNPGEWAECVIAADRAGLTVADWIRHACKRQWTQERKGKV